MARTSSESLLMQYCGCQKCYERLRSVAFFHPLGSEFRHAILVRRAAVAGEWCSILRLSRAKFFLDPAKEDTKMPFSGEAGGVGGLTVASSLASSAYKSACSCKRLISSCHPSTWVSSFSFAFTCRINPSYALCSSCGVTPRLKSRDERNSISSLFNSVVGSPPT